MISGKNPPRQPPDSVAAVTYSLIFRRSRTRPMRRRRGVGARKSGGRRGPAGVDMGVAAAAIDQDIERFPFLARAGHADPEQQSPGLQGFDIVGAVPVSDKALDHVAQPQRADARRHHGGNRARDRSAGQGGKARYLQAAPATLPPRSARPSRPGPACRDSRARHPPLRASRGWSWIDRSAGAKPAATSRFAAARNSSLGRERGDRLADAAGWFRFVFVGGFAAIAHTGGGLGGGRRLGRRGRADRRHRGGRRGRRTRHARTRAPGAAWRRFSSAAAFARRLFSPVPCGQIFRPGGFGGRGPPCRRRAARCRLGFYLGLGLGLDLRLGRPVYAPSISLPSPSRHSPRSLGNSPISDGMLACLASKPMP